jgi:hypothetical protein
LLPSVESLSNQIKRASLICILPASGFPLDSGMVEVYPRFHSRLI